MWPLYHRITYHSEPCTSAAAAAATQELVFSSTLHEDAKAIFHQCDTQEDIRPDSHHRSGHAPLTSTVQYFLMHFTASIHTGGHAPFAIESKDISTRTWLPVWTLIIWIIWSQSSYGSAGLRWRCIAGSPCQPRCLHHGNDEWTRIWPCREWSLSRTWQEL